MALHGEGIGGVIFLAYVSCPCFIIAPAGPGRVMHAHAQTRDLLTDLQTIPRQPQHPLIRLHHPPHQARLGLCLSPHPRPPPPRRAVSQHRLGYPILYRCRRPHCLLRARRRRLLLARTMHLPLLDPSPRVCHAHFGLVVGGQAEKGSQGGQAAVVQAVRDGHDGEGCRGEQAAVDHDCYTLGVDRGE